MVLLIAMMLAIAAGMMAGGPILLSPADHALDRRPWLGIPQALATLPLAAVGAWGLRAAWDSGWPDALRTPWRAFFGACIAVAITALACALGPNGVALALLHACLAAAMTMAMLCFMAERVDALFGRHEAIAAGAAVAGCSGLWWLAGHWSDGAGDLRALLFLQSMPLLLVPAGGLGLPGLHTRAVDWLAMLGLYVLGRAAGFADPSLGRALMPLLLAAMAGWAAYRVVTASVAPSGRGASRAGPTQRSTSLNTSS